MSANRNSFSAEMYDGSSGSISNISDGYAFLRGKRVGARAYTQTTGIWIRGILRQTYGVDPSSIAWMCTGDPHLAEYADPANVQRLAVPSDQIGALLAAGRIDAAIFGADLPR